jgi:hypothetical protein
MSEALAVNGCKGKGGKKTTTTTAAAAGSCKEHSLIRKELQGHNTQP